MSNSILNDIFVCIRIYMNISSYFLISELLFVIKLYIYIYILLPWMRSNSWLKRITCALFYHLRHYNFMKKKVYYVIYKYRGTKSNNSNIQNLNSPQIRADQSRFSLPNSFQFLTCSKLIVMGEAQYKGSKWINVDLFAIAKHLFLLKKTNSKK